MSQTTVSDWMKNDFKCNFIALAVTEVGIWISGRFILWFHRSSGSPRAFELKTPDCLKGKRPLCQRILTFDIWPHTCINLCVSDGQTRKETWWWEIWHEIRRHKKISMLAARPHWSNAYQYILLDKVLQSSETWQTTWATNGTVSFEPLTFVFGNMRAVILRSVFMEVVCNIRSKCHQIQIYSLRFVPNKLGGRIAKSKSSEVK